MRSAGWRRLPSRRDSICTSRTRITKGTQSETTGRVPPPSAVQRRPHRCPPQQQGTNEAKPASLFPHATQPNSHEKQEFPNEPMVDPHPQETRPLPHLKTNPKNEPTGCAPPHSGSSGGRTGARPESRTRRTKPNRPAMPPATQPSIPEMQEITNEPKKSHVFNTSPTKTNPFSHAQPQPARSVPALPAESARRPTRCAPPRRSRPARALARAACHPRVCHGPGVFGSTRRWHPPPHLC